MTKFSVVFILIVLLIHAILAVVGTRVLLKNTILTLRQRKLNLILLWAIPIIWYLIIKTLHKSVLGSYEVSIKNDISSNQFHESGSGSTFTSMDN